MANEDLLLRMLSPVVRPDGVSPVGRQAARQPFESRPFESFLDEARHMDVTDDAASAAAKPACAAPPGLDNIENPQVRSLLTNLHQSARRPDASA